MPSRLESRQASPFAAPTMVIIEDQALLRTSIVFILKREFGDWNFIETPSIECLQMAGGCDVRFVVYDTGDKQFDDPDFVASVTSIRRSFPAAEIGVLSDAVNPDLAFMALKLGVRGVFTKSQSIDVALFAIRIVLAGGIYCPREPDPRHEESFSLPSPRSEERGILSSFSERTPPFTPREEEVLDKLGLGLSNKVIAAHLNLSENTVKMHIQHVMRKLCVQNRTEVVVRLGARMKGRRPDILQRLA